MMFFYTTHSLDVVNNYSRRNNRNRTIHDDHRESQLSEDGVSVENNKDFTKVKDQSHSDDVTQVTYEPDTEESLYANSAVAVSSFEGYVARKMARTKELSDDYKVLYYLDIIKSFLKDFEKLIILFLGCINCNNIAIFTQLFPPPDLSRCKMALTADNKQKNRYRNIYACKLLYNKHKKEITNV